MKYIFSLVGMLILCLSCSEIEMTPNQDLCTPIVCGEIQNNDVNLALFNDSGIDFDTLYYDIGGQSDSIGFFPLNQYTCWINLDTLNTEYFLALGVSDSQVFRSDTLWMQQNSEMFTTGVFVLEIYRMESSDKLDLDFVEDYSGECRDF
ncbi:hypothetical protein SAMN05661096_00809 [Marivirga sericea]|uniref:Uncharacterized protein n=1 Tax=Marivirga sericea TaxID=1028 RepID=A0A1X7ILD8_9BACT|nr:hypothetical protein [Marivirga sericea]SMG15799.1 hypothetical protein SAMN05661096_00809 [Marivirga sericea]